MVFTTTEAMAFIFYCDLWLYCDRDCRDYYRFPLSSLSFRHKQGTDILVESWFPFVLWGRPHVLLRRKPPAKKQTFRVPGKETHRETWGNLGSLGFTTTEAMAPPTKQTFSRSSNKKHTREFAQCQRDVRSDRGRQRATASRATERDCVRVERSAGRPLLARVPICKNK